MLTAVLQHVPRNRHDIAQTQTWYKTTIVFISSSQAPSPLFFLWIPLKTDSQCCRSTLRPQTLFWRQQSEKIKRQRRCLFSVLCFELEPSQMKVGWCCGENSGWISLFFRGSDVRSSLTSPGPSGFDAFFNLIILLSCSILRNKVRCHTGAYYSGDGRETR